MGSNGIEYDICVGLVIICCDVLYFYLLVVLWVILDVLIWMKELFVEIIILFFVWIFICLLVDSSCVIFLVMRFRLLFCVCIFILFLVENSLILVLKVNRLIFLVMLVSRFLLVVMLVFEFEDKVIFFLVCVCSFLCVVRLMLLGDVVSRMVCLKWLVFDCVVFG